MDIKDVEDKQGVMKIRILNTIIKQARKFIISTANMVLLEILRKYFRFWPLYTPHAMLFVAHRDGKCFPQPVKELILLEISLSRLRNF